MSLPFASCARAALLAAGCAVLAASALAQQPAGVPPLKTEGAARYACGGIGIDESTAFRAAAGQHALSLLFAAPGGDYQADVQVRIADAKGAQVLDVRADGPVCLIDLPHGSYTVEARRGEGAAQKRSVAIDGKPQRLDFRF